MKNTDTSEESLKECCKEKMMCKGHHGHSCGDSGAIYCMGVIGALFYFLQNAPNFGAVMISIGKSVFWPAILMFKLLTYLQM